MKLHFDGLTSTEDFLTVHMTIQEGSWMKFGAVKVPMARLLDPHITDNLDRVVRRKLIQVWSEVDLSDGLF